MNTPRLFSQATQPINTTADPPLSDKDAHDNDAHDHPALDLLPEIQTPPPEEVTLTTASEVQVSSTESSSSQAPVLSIDTLTPPPEVEPSLSTERTETLVKDEGEALFVCHFFLQQAAFRIILQNKINCYKYMLM